MTDNLDSITINSYSNTREHNPEIKRSLMKTKSHAISNEILIINSQWSWHKLQYEA